LNGAVSNHRHGHGSEPKRFKLVQRADHKLDIPINVRYTVLRKKLFRSGTSSSAFFGINYDCIAGGSHCQFLSYPIAEIGLGIEF
jgi:hypothetical protein